MSSVWGKMKNVHNGCKYRAKPVLSWPSCSLIELVNSKKPLAVRIYLVHCHRKAFIAFAAISVENERHEFNLEGAMGVGMCLAVVD